MTDNQVSRRTVELVCKHQVTFSMHPPMIGELIWCVKCADMRRVERGPEQFRIRCKTCTYGARFGDARVNAELAAGRHRRRHPGHKVGIYNGKQHIYTMGANDDASQSALFPAHSFPADPPF